MNFRQSSESRSVKHRRRICPGVQILRPDDNGTFVAFLPAIPGCHAWGKTPEEAQSELLNVFDMIKEDYEEEGRMLPEDIEVKAVYACQG